MDWWSEGKHFWWLSGTISKLKKSSRVMTHRVWSQTIWIPLMLVMMKRFHKTSQSIHPVDVWVSEVDHVAMEGGLVWWSMASCFLIPRRNSCVCMHNIRQMIAKGLDNITQWKYAKKIQYNTINLYYSRICLNKWSILGTVYVRYLALLLEKTRL